MAAVKNIFESEVTEISNSRTSLLDNCSLSVENKSEMNKSMESLYHILKRLSWEKPISPIAIGCMHSRPLQRNASELIAIVRLQYFFISRPLLNKKRSKSAEDLKLIVKKSNSNSYSYTIMLSWIDGRMKEWSSSDF